MSVNVNCYSDPSVDLSDDTDGVVAFADDAEMYRTTIAAHTGIHTYGGVFRAQGSTGGYTDCDSIEIVGATRMLVQTPRKHSGVVGIVDAGKVVAKVYTPSRAYVSGSSVVIETPKP